MPSFCTLTSADPPNTHWNSQSCSARSRHSALSVLRESGTRPMYASIGVDVPMGKIDPVPTMPKRFPPRTSQLYVHRPGPMSMERTEPEARSIMSCAAVEWLAFCSD
eukprot:1154237-Rhodomonas_salina.2